MSGLYQDEFLQGLRSGLASLLPQWRLSAQTHLTLLCISENATYLAVDPARDNALVLRVHRPGYHTINEIESELRWIIALRERHIVRTPAPVANVDGTLLCSFHHDGEHRQVVAFEFMAGTEPDQSSDLISSFSQLGEITARLHRHSQQWQPVRRHVRQPGGRHVRQFERKIWDFETTLGARPHWGRWQDAVGGTADGQAILTRCASVLATELQTYGKGADKFGLIHADLRLANLLQDETAQDDHNLAVIDFDDCGFSWYLYDFAASVSFIETSPDLPELTAAWIEGYRRIAPLAAQDIAALGMFVMLRRMLLTAWIASHYETPTAKNQGANYTIGTIELAEAYLVNA